MRKLDIALRLMRLTGALDLVRALGRFGAPRLSVLAYHRVLTTGPEAQYPFDIELVSADPAEFDWQVRYLKANHDVIAFRDVIDSMDGGARLPKRPVVITFDDGFSDNYEHAFPVLKSHGVPGTFFISTDYMGGSRTFWFDRVAALLLRMPVGALKLPELPAPLPSGDSVSQRRGDVDTLLEALKAVTEERRLEIMDSLETTWSGLLTPDLDRLSRPMTWEQVHEMLRGGMEFGSHSHTHPVLSRLSAAQLEAELVESKREIESRLGVPSHTLSYPVGMGDAVDDKVCSAAARAGYRIACSYERGVNAVPRANHYSLRRQHVERYVSREYFRMLVDAPWMYP